MPHPEMPALLLMNFEYPPLGGGSGNATYHLAHALASLGCKTGVLTARFRGQRAREDEGGVKLYRVPVVRRHVDRCTPFELLTFVVSATARSAAIARDFAPDACLAFLGTHTGPVAWWLHRRRRVPYVVLLRGGDVPGFLPEQLGLYHRLMLPLLRRIWRDAVAIVANSPGLREIALAGMPGHEIHVIPNGVDSIFFHPAPKKETAAGPLRLLYAGRFSWGKDLPTLMRALAPLRDQHAFELWLAGDGPETERISAAAREAGLLERIRFLGWLKREELARTYRDADLFVFPSLAEAMPNAVLEAMASGLPVVAVSTPGTNELIRPGVNGYLLTHGGVTQMTCALREMMLDDDLRLRFGSASREMASQRSWESVARSYLALVAAALRGESGAHSRL